MITQHYFLRNSLSYQPFTPRLSRIRVSWKKDTKYYKLLFQPTLFGTIDVVFIWGRVGGNLGGYKVISYNNMEDASNSQ